METFKRIYQGNNFAGGIIKSILDELGVNYKVMTGRIDIPVCPHHFDKACSVYTPSISPDCQTPYWKCWNSTHACHEVLGRSLVGLIRGIRRESIQETLHYLSNYLGPRPKHKPTRLFNLAGATQYIKRANEIILCQNKADLTAIRMNGRPQIVCCEAQFTWREKMELDNTEVTTLKIVGDEDFILDVKTLCEEYYSITVEPSPIAVMTTE